MTASEAEEAVSKAEGLTKAMEAAEQLDASKLDAEIAGLRQVWPRITTTPFLLILTPTWILLCVVTARLFRGIPLDSLGVSKDILSPLKLRGRQQ